MSIHDNVNTEAWAVFSITNVVALITELSQQNWTTIAKLNHHPKTLGVIHNCQHFPQCTKSRISQLPLPQKSTRKMLTFPVHFHS